MAPPEYLTGMMKLRVHLGLPVEILDQQTNRPIGRGNRSLGSSGRGMFVMRLQRVHACWVLLDVPMRP